MLKLHLGCGKRNLPGYVHIDVDAHPHIDYCTSIDNLPMIQDNSVDEIYTCGVIPYFDRDEINTALCEWHRVLKKDGILRISVIDFERQVEVYLSNNTDLENLGVLGPIFGKWDYTTPEGQNKSMYKKNAYDFKYLKKVLESNGFKDYQRYNWKDFLPEGYDDYSAAYVPHGDQNGIPMMLNIWCRKC
jgi:ubiquinone/menaquinone biosynthesis C-methylase UbiE